MGGRDLIPSLHRNITPNSFGSNECVKYDSNPTNNIFYSYSMRPAIPLAGTQPHLAATLEDTQHQCCW